MPSAWICSAQPNLSSTSRTSPWIRHAFEPCLRRCESASSSTLGMPSEARRAARLRPTGPAPTMPTGVISGRFKVDVSFRVFDRAKDRNLPHGLEVSRALGGAGALLLVAEHPHRDAVVGLTPAPQRAREATHRGGQLLALSAG